MLCIKTTKNWLTQNLLRVSSNGQSFEMNNKSNKHFQNSPTNFTICPASLSVCMTSIKIKMSKVLSNVDCYARIHLITQKIAIIKPENIHFCNLSQQSSLCWWNSCVIEWHGCKILCKNSNENTKMDEKPEYFFLSNMQNNMYFMGMVVMYRIVHICWWRALI